MQQLIKDHPRLRGENMEAMESRFSQVGSSPLTRGKLYQVNIKSNSKRIIPAYAGKTLIVMIRQVCRQDHPRLRGENWLEPEPVQTGEGSSPLTRGKLPFHMVDVKDLRIIPAYAGKTFLKRLDWRTKKDHPRLRGENRIPGKTQPGN